MARYTKAVDIWSIDQEGRSRLQIGQWVTAGPGGQRGRFYGASSRSTVVAWLGNARGRYRRYMQTLRDYGRTVKA